MCVGPGGTNPVMIINVFTLHSLKDFFVSIKVFVKVVLVSIMKVFNSQRESICERERASKNAKVGFYSSSSVCCCYH